ncbi:MAG: alanine dehydrogenase [Gammaproteobacteria bacterium]|nr:alanine dehydrogenase [Gammaproteobacteria bacterium]
MSNIGVAKEIKIMEGRVALIPAACAELVAAGHALFVQQNAGLLSGYDDVAYRQAGAVVVADAAKLYQRAELIVKVKEPVTEDLRHLKAHHRLFCYLHLAALPKLAAELQAIGATAIAFETVEEAGGALPLLAPMSQIAGKIAVQSGVHLLHQPMGGSGLLLGGVAGTPRGKVVVLGAGQAGSSAVELAAALGAEVTVFDRLPARLEAMRLFGHNVSPRYAYAADIAAAVAEADLLIGAVLLAGRRAPRIVSDADIKTMQKGSVVVDISVDQGGCIETTHATTYQDPTYLCHDVLHFAVSNMPGAVPQTASQALSAAITPYVTQLADDGWMQNNGLQRAVNIAAGEVIHPSLRLDLCP